MEDYLGSINIDKQKPQESGKIGTRDIVINIISSIIILIVVSIANGFMSSDFKYEQIFTWNMGLLVVVNWTCGIAFTYTLRQIGITMATATKPYQEALREEQEAFDSIKDYAEAQERLDDQIARDFEYRKKVLEDNIAKLVQHKLPQGKVWKQGQPLPDKTRPKIKRMARYLERMTPPTISLIQLGETETAKVPKSLFDLPTDPTSTGAEWFAKKGMGKLVFFAVVPILLSLIASSLVGGATFGSFMIIAGTLGAMLFNGGRSLSVSYYGVIKGGIQRLKRITRIIKLVS